MYKKGILVLISISLLTLILLGCTHSEYKEQKISEVTNIKFNKVTKIVFIDGAGGRNKPFTITNKQKISEFTGLMDHYIIRKEKRHKPSAGWMRMASFYKGSNKLMSITFTDPLQIDGKYYEIIKGDVSIKEIDQFIRTVNPSWKSPLGNK